MSTIRYTLQSSSAILGVYCNTCDAFCNFAYSLHCKNIAYWEQDKKKILCPSCAEQNPDRVWRKVYSKYDLPIDRSSFYSTWDRYLFSDANNKKTHWYFFECEKDPVLEGNKCMYDKCKKEMNELYI